MKIKTQRQTQTLLDIFDVMDSSRKETNLSKFLAYILSKNPYALKTVIDLIDGTDDVLKGKKAALVLERTSIEIEKSYTSEQLDIENEKGRTDIEIKVYDRKEPTNLLLFIIIECKVHKNKATPIQFLKYRNVFQLDCNKGAKFKYFVYLSNQSGINLLGNNEIKQVDINWRELINSLYKVEDINHTYQDELKNFINYYERSYGMSNQKEILVQDLGIPNEIDRFFNNIYRRNKVNGSPLYFAPYFTRNNDTQEEGISHISKILGIITTNDISWEKIKESCEKFINLFDDKCLYKEELLNKWKNGIAKDEKFLTDIQMQINELNNILQAKQKALENHREHKYAKSRKNLENEISEIKEILSKDDNVSAYWKDSIYTYYFLDNPTKLNSPLLKDGGNKIGRGKNWIAAAIPPNRCVSFSDFLQHSSLVTKPEC